MGFVKLQHLSSQLAHHLHSHTRCGFEQVWDFNRLRATHPLRTTLIHHLLRMAGLMSIVPRQVDLHLAVRSLARIDRLDLLLPAATWRLERLLLQACWRRGVPRVLFLLALFRGRCSACGGAAALLRLLGGGARLIVDELAAADRVVVFFNDFSCRSGGC